MSILLIALTLACVAAWFITKKTGWALPTAIFLYLLVASYTDVNDWLSVLFWMLVLVGVGVLLFAVRFFVKAALVALAFAVLVAIGYSIAVTANDVANAAPGVAQDLTVHPGDLAPAEAKCTSDEFIDNSLSTANGRKWSDSVSTPFKATAKEDMRKELLAEICQNPVLGDAYAQALNDAVIGDFKVGPANPWLGEFLAKADKPGLRTAYLTKKAGRGNEVYVTKEYQEKAQLVNMLLLKLVNQGVVKGQTSTANWPLRSMVAGELPRAYKVTDPKKQENLPFLALAYTTKAGSGTCAAYVLGVNTQDKRPENFGCEVATKVAPKHPTTPPPVVTSHPTSPPSTHTTPPTGHPSTPPSAPPTTPPTTTPPTPHSCPPGTFWSEKYKECLENKVNQTPPAAPTNRPPAGAPTGPKENTPPTQPNPANPTDKPGSGSTLPAPGATTAPQPTAPAPTATNAPPPSAPVTTNPNPDGH